MSPIRKCQAKTFPCPAGDRCPGFQDTIAAHNPVFKEVLHENHLHLPRDLAQTICATSQGDVRNYIDLGEDLLLRGTRVAYCEKHGVYHRYDREQVDLDMRKLVSPLHQTIERVGFHLSRAETQPVHTLVNDNLTRMGEHLRAEQEKFVAWRDETMRQPAHKALRLAAERKREAQRTAARQQQPVTEQRVRATQDPAVERAAIAAKFTEASAKTPNYRARKAAERAAVPLLVDATQLSHTQLMEFHVCYRKRKFGSQQEALNFIEPANVRAAPDARKEAYKCPFCHSIHLGSAPKRVRAITGTNLGGDDANRANAARSWRHYRAKANEYALAKNLITVSDAFDRSLAAAA